MKAIQARYPTSCHLGEHEIRPGEWVVRDAESGTWVHEDCTLNDDGFRYVSRPEMDGEGFNSRTAGIPVLPRGTTGKDKCTDCFMVHSPGQDGCE